MQRRFRKIDNKLLKNLKINLGCGFLKEEGAIGIDLRDCGQELIWDVREGIPFPDESADMVCSSHFLEHLTNQESLDLFQEIYRVLKPGGITEHILPHATDPTAHYFGHNSYWNEQRIETFARKGGIEGFIILANASINRGLGGAKRELVFRLMKKKK